MKKILFFLVLITAFFGTTSQVKADHSWGGYHWARTNPFNLKLGNNLTSAWVPYLNTASTDWSTSSVLDTSVVAGLSNAKNCKATAGRVEVCNSKYGNNGWLGIAQIWISGGTHITQGTTKMNDTYFSAAKYNTPAWKQLVVCQEVAHTFGLDHQDETFDNSNLGTCMDYTNSPESNQHPNAHDFEELTAIYSHADSFTTVNQSTAQIAKLIGQQIANTNLDNPGEWGRLVSDNNKVAVYERDFGFGNKIVTHIIWAE